jgi:hypothetical protein
VSYIIIGYQSIIDVFIDERFPPVPEYFGGSFLLMLKQQYLQQKQQLFIAVVLFVGLHQINNPLLI